MNRMAVLALSFFSVLSLAVPKTGEKAPDFKLKDANGKEFNLKDYAGKNLVVLEWFNKDCPFVKKHYESKNMQTLQSNYMGQGVVWFQIASANTAKMTKEDAAANTTSTALLLDTDGAVAKAYGAKTTPHMFVIDKAGKVAYQGAIDAKATADQADIKGTQNYVHDALEVLLKPEVKGQPVKVAISTTKPYGCSVKY